MQLPAKPSTEAERRQQQVEQGAEAPVDGHGGDVPGAGARVPVWLAYDPAALSAQVTTMPRREDAEPGINDLLIVEFYSR